MKNIAIINTSYNLSLSTCKLSLGLFNYLRSHKYNVFYCYGRGPRKEETYFYRIDKPWQIRLHALLSRIVGIQGFFSVLPTLRLIYFLKKNKIDTIYAGTLHGYYLQENILLSFIAQHNINLIYMLFDEYPYLGKCCYAKECKNYLIGCGNCPSIKDYPKSLYFDFSRYIYKWKEINYAKIKNISFVAPEFVNKNSRLSPLTKNVNSFSVDFGIDLDVYKPIDTSDLRQKLGIVEEKKIVVCIAPSAYPEKGCIYYIKLAQAMIAYDEYVFVHVGYTSSDTEKLPLNYIPIGYVSNQQEIIKYYSIGDLFVFPSLVDAMPNTCLEALACGTPLLLFNTSGMPYLADDTVANYVEPKCVEAMVDVVLKIRKKDNSTIDRCRGYAMKRYNKKDYFSKLMEIGNNSKKSVSIRNDVSVQK